MPPDAREKTREGAGGGAEECAGAASGSTRASAGESPPALTVYFDGACPLCRAEIAHYAAEPGAAQLCFRDVSRDAPAPGPDLTAADALARFHVRTSDGSLLSGAAAFAAIWRLLPRWRWVARVAGLPGAMTVLEAGYRLFLPLRPPLSRLAGAVMRRRESRRGERSDR